jgi:hypothetical protein
MCKKSGKQGLKALWGFIFFFSKRPTLPAALSAWRLLVLAAAGFYPLAKPAFSVKPKEAVATSLPNHGEHTHA